MAKRKYRLLMLLLLAADMMTICYLGYRYLDRKVPDKILVSEEEGNTLVEALENPWIHVEEAVEAAGNGGYHLETTILGVIPFKEIKVENQQRQTVLVSGEPVGIYMETEGVLIVDTGEILSKEGISQYPAENIVQPGDYIVAFNEQNVNTKKQLVEDISECSGEPVCLTVKRQGETFPISVNPVMDQNGEYKLGIWVRDNTQGIGTLTYVDMQGNYGALGHGISDVDTGELLEIRSGNLYEAQILSIRKGSKGNPGELAGLIRYEDAKKMGSITYNTGNGIYGTINHAEETGLSLQSYPVGYKQEMELGQATILCRAEDEVKEYQAEITQIDMNHEDTNKSFVIQVTDPALLEATGGIVQGMSGSPVLQNGRFVGAVTHVFVQDAASGYGIFAETMLEQNF